MLNFRVSEEEAALLSTYAKEVGQSMTDVVRAFIRSLEGKLKRVEPATVAPELLPSVPLSRTILVPPVAAVYFILTEAGEVLYVGQSGNMVKRHVDHHRHEEALCIDPHARIHWLERRSLREAFERACIERFSPRLNRNRWGS
jgi:hypothetical protein